MKKLILFSVLLITALSFWSCSKDNDDEGINGNAALYDLTIENNTGQEIQIFIKGGESDFERKGILEAGEKMVVSNLGVRIIYIIRASLPGGSLEEFFYEQTINRTSPTNFTLTING